MRNKRLAILAVVLALALSLTGCSLFRGNVTPQWITNFTGMEIDTPTGSTHIGLDVDQVGTGDIVDFKDGGTTVWQIADGGAVTAGSDLAVGGTAGATIALGVDDTTADDIDIGSAKDDVLISGEDITLDTADDADVLVADDFTFTMESASGLWTVTGTPGLVIAVGTDDTTADNIDLGSAKDDVDIEGEDITLDTADDADVAVADDFTVTLESASGKFVLAGTAGSDIDLATDDTTADDIDVGSAKDDVLISGEDITLDTADDADVLIADDFTFTVESASGKWVVGGTAGSDIDIATDDTTADTITVGSAKDDVDLAGEDIALTSADDLHILGGSASSIINIGTNADGNVLNVATDNSAADDINVGSALDDVLIAGEDITLDTADDADVLVADDFTFTMETAANIWAVTGTPGFVVNICTDDTTADDINIGSAKDDVDVAGATIDLTGGDDILNIGDTDDTIEFTRNDSGSVTFTCADDDANATCIYDSGGTGAAQVGSADSSSVNLIADSDVQIQGGATGNVDLSFHDYADSSDDDMAHALLRANCTTATTGAEDCDFSISVPEAGSAVNERFLIDADDGIDIGSTTNANVTLISGSDTLIHDGDLTLDTDATGGNALAKNEYIGLPRITLAPLGTMVNGTTNTVIVDMGDSQTPATDWTADPDADVVMSNDTTYYRESTASLKMAVSTAADDDDGTINLLGTGDQNWTDDEAVGFWFYADTTFAGTELDFNIHDSGPVDSAVLLPAYATANTWVWVELDISGVANASKDVIENVSIRLTADGATKAAGAAFNVYFDFIVKWDVADEDALPQAIPYDGVLGLMTIDVTSAGAAAVTPVLYTDYFVHYQSGADAIVAITDQSGTDILGIALIAY